FFFQAEDGIRDLTVTGVQTCALPIYIDKAMQLGCGYPMGPLTLLDFVGLDTTYKIAEIMFTEYREQRYAPPPLLKRMVLAGMNRSEERRVGKSVERGGRSVGKNKKSK